MQDNGGCAEPLGRKDKDQYQPREDKPTLPGIPPDKQHYWGLMPNQTRDGWPRRQGEGVMPGPADTYIGYGNSHPHALRT